MTPEAPRLLLVTSDPLGGTSGTAVTLSNLFGGWPVDRIAQLHLMPAAEGSTIARRRVSPRTFAFELQRERLAGLAPAPREARPLPAITAAGHRASGPRARVRREVSALLDMVPPRLRPEDREWIAAFDPDVVYSLLGSIRMIRVATAVAACAGVPLVPHFMDDWPSTIYSAHEALGAAKRAMHRSLRVAIRRAPIGLAISEPMALEYGDRFGLPFDVFGNCVDLTAFDDSPPDRNDGAVRLAYVGGLHLGRAETLAAVGRALDATASRTGRVLELVIHAPPVHLSTYADRFTELRSVRLAGSLPAEEVANALSRADVLVHVESFDPTNAAYTRLSLSTKLPQYLAAGRPILAVGPCELASTSLVESSGAGVVVGTVAPTDLERGIVRLLLAEIRQQMGRHGRALASAHFDRASVRARLYTVLSDASRTG